MTKIDTSGWGEFRIGDMFDVSYGKFIAKKEADENANIPHITASGVNNGISYNVSEAMFPANCLTVASDGAIGATYYQDTPFSASNIVSVLVPHTGIDLSKYVALFICTAIKAASRKYSWGGFKFSVDRVRNTTILLPQTPDHTPDFDYMEHYMKEITKLATKRVEKLKKEKPQTKIDTSNWKKLKVGELFDCETTKGIASKNDLVEGNIPYVTRSAENNGKSGYCGNADRIVKGNCITIGAEGFTAFYQENDFVAGNKVYALRHRNLNNVNALYICTVLNKLSCLYSFNNARILDKIKQEIISLPIDNNGEPDWQYMEDYMKEITQFAAKRVEKLKEENPQTKIDTSNWKKFKVEELFDVTNGKKYPSSIRQTGELPLVSTTANNNGISDYIKDRNDGVYSNCITVAYSGSVGATFYHKEKVFVGETVIALLPKFKMNQYSGLFICSILSKINSKFSYIQKIKASQYKNEAISLPVTPEGTPDFDYMENYMKNLTEKAEKKI